MNKIILPLIIVLCMLTVSAIAAKEVNPTEKELAKMSKDYKSKPQHEDLACGDCHNAETPLSDYYLIDSESCLNCHGSREEVAERTAALDAKEVNPHNSFHSRYAAECYECHREHKPSRNYCGNCHDIDLWMKPTP